jgi:hypothetical protein
LAPGLLDRYLARTAFDSQMTKHDLEPAGHDNLFEPVDEDRGAHGPFDDQAHGFSAQYQLAKHRRIVLAGMGAALAGAGAALARSNR